MIGIRADANREIGMGHVMRCLSVATALKERGQEVCFILADESAAELLEGRGMRYYILGSDYRDMESELPVLERWLAEEKPQCLLIDSYYVSAKYLELLRQRTRTVYLDDVNAFPYPVDILVNYNIYGDLLPYREQASNSQMQFLLGTAYVPLRKEFQNVKYSVRPDVRNVLITTGGSDKYNLAGKILEILLQDNRTGQFCYHVVSGAFNANLPYLEALAGEHENIKIHQNVSEMSELMQKCDVAITAGGSTMYELSAVGVPIICFSFVDNQERIVQTFADRGIVGYGGNYLTEKEELLEKVKACLAELSESREKRQTFSDRQRRLVDGLGAMRVAEILCELGIV